MSDDSPRIALFGGTFDPIHYGHMRIAQAAKESLKLDRVVFIPCALSPHKLEGELPLAGASRMDMVLIACEKYPWMQIDACELERNGASYSWQTAEHFRARFPDAKLFWILGDDQWQALPGWNHPERLASLVEFIVFARNHRKPAALEGIKAWFLPEVHEGSATDIRNALRSSGESGGSHPWVDPKVMDYIRSHRLYGVDQ